MLVNITLFSSTEINHKMEAECYSDGDSAIHLLYHRDFLWKLSLHVTFGIWVSDKSERVTFRQDPDALRSPVISR